MINTREVQLMGTVIQLSIQHTHAEKILEQLVDELKELEQRFSAHDVKSELMRVNQAAGIKAVNVESGLYELIKIGKKHSIAQNSYLNIAIGPLVRAWRIGFTDAKVPNQQTIDKLLKKTQAEKIILNDLTETVYLEDTGMFLDLGALAKGFIADIMINRFKALHVNAGLINLGGNVMTYGNSPNLSDGYWRIGIQHPLLSRGNNLAVLRVLNQSVVTSGIYERKYTIKDKTYHHILDPQTGYPIETDIASLTIVSEKSVDGEIWTGRLFGETKDKIIEVVEKLDGIECILILKTGELYFTEALEPYIRKMM